MVSSNIYRAPQIKLKRTRIAPNTIFPNKISQTGVNPVTGKYLSAEERKLIFKRKTVSSKNVFSRPGALVKVEKPGALVKVGQPGALTRQDDGSGKGISFNILFARVVAVEKQVAFLAKALDKEAELEKKARKEYEKEQLQEEERDRRSVKEKNLEKGIFKTLISPVQAVAGKAQSVLGNLMAFFGVLLGGWLTNQGWKAIKANAEGDIDKLKSIGVEVGKTLGVVAGIFALLNGGLFTILGIIGKITFAILSAPFKLLAKGIEALWNKVRNKPPTPSAGGGGGAPNAGGGSPNTSLSKMQGGSNTGLDYRKNTNPKTGRRLRSGASIGRYNESFARNIQGKANLGDKARLFFRGDWKELLNRFTSSNPVKGIQGALNFVKKSPIVGWLFKKFINLAKWALGIFKPENLQKIGNNLGKVKVLGRLLGPLFAVIDIQKRANMGMSPAQAIIPAILKAVMTSGAAILGGSVPIPGINIATSLAGGYAGGWLGDRVMEGIDSIWDKSWDDKLFEGFNNAVMGIGKADPTGLVSKFFPYEGPDKKYDKTKISATTPTEPQPTPSPSISSSPSSMPSAPGPVSGGGNTTVIYKKVGGAGRGAGDQSLKSGSATDVPLIASANPSNFYTMYSQIVYNVVN